MNCEDVAVKALFMVVAWRSYSTIRMPSTSQKTVAICLPAQEDVSNFLG
jgi:hypothetical protein